MHDDFNTAEAYHAYLKWYRNEEKKKIRRRRLKKMVLFLSAAAVVYFGIVAALSLPKKTVSDYSMPEISVQLIEPYVTARRCVSLDKVRGIVIHYTGNPGSTAQGNRDYFNTERTEVCSHFIIGLSLIHI